LDCKQLGIEPIIFKEMRELLNVVGSGKKRDKKKLIIRNISKRWERSQSINESIKILIKHSSNIKWIIKP